MVASPGIAATTLTTRHGHHVQLAIRPSDHPQASDQRRWIADGDHDPSTTPA
jgi:hypothetical protein